MTLNAAEHFEWFALRRVNRGGMTRSGTGFVNSGQPLGEFLAEVVAELIEQRLLDVGEVSPRDGLARVQHTTRGRPGTRSCAESSAAQLHGAPSERPGSPAGDCWSGSPCRDPPRLRWSSWPGSTSITVDPWTTT